MRGKAIASHARLVESYWVIPGQLLAGEYPAHVERPDAIARLDSLLAQGIDTFLDLTEPGELSPYLPMLDQQAKLKQVRVTHHRFPIVDFGLPEPSMMWDILDRIDVALADAHHIYLHCWGGLGRTGMVVGCHLVRHGQTGEAALEQICEFWRSQSARRSAPLSPETPAQVQFVLDWSGLEDLARK